VFIYLFPHASCADKINQKVSQVAPVDGTGQYYCVELYDPFRTSCGLVQLQYALVDHSYIPLRATVSLIYVVDFYFDIWQCQTLRVFF